MTSDTGTKAMCGADGAMPSGEAGMGFVIPFEGNQPSENVLNQIADEVNSEKTPVSWNFSTMPSEEWKNGVGSALTTYAADQSDGNWDGVGSRIRRWLGHRGGRCRVVGTCCNGAGHPASCLHRNVTAWAGQVPPAVAVSRVRRSAYGKAIKKYWPVFLAPMSYRFSSVFIVPFILGVWLSFCDFTTVTDAQFTGIENYLRAFRGHHLPACVLVHGPSSPSCRFS